MGMISLVCNHKTLSGIFFCFSLVAGLVGLYHFKGKIRKPFPNSYYFQQDIQRRDDVHQYLSTRQSKKQQAENPSIIIGIITSFRNYGDINFNYPLQVVGTFLKMLSEKNDDKFGIFLCNASSPNGLEKTFVESQFKEKFLHRFINYDGNLRIQKELKDYVTCLTTIKKRFPSVKYIILNEDDGIPLPGFYESIELIIQQIEFNSKHIPFKTISHVKLHHGTEFRKLPYLIFIFVIPLSVLSFIKLVCYELKLVVNNLYLLLFSILLFSLIYIAGPQIVGKVHQKLTLSFFPLVMPESCCLVSVLYPVDNLQDTLDYLVKSSKRRPLTPKDSLLDDLPTETGMTVYMTEYNLVKHIGIFSSLRNNHYKLSKDINEFKRMIGKTS